MTTESIFVRNYHRAGMMPRGSKGEWYSVTLANIVLLHVFTQDGVKWQTKVTGVATTEGSGFASREEAERAAIRLTRQRLENALKELSEKSEEDNE
jgi:hypothetical protein